MKVSEALLDERIDDNTTVVIRDSIGWPVVCGRWYQDKILEWGNFDTSLDFVEEINIAVLQLVV